MKLIFHFTTALHPPTTAGTSSKHPSTDHCIVSSSISQLGSRPSCSCTLWNIYLFTMGSKTKISLSIIFISYEIQGDLINSGWCWSISFNLQGRAVVSKCGRMGGRCRLNSDIWSNDYFDSSKRCCCDIVPLDKFRQRLRGLSCRDKRKNI